ncbi:hypothetical protein [Colwellia demingiae]|uniref:hypothetical protein n=1 Tax=Colwellia demingiae TaxID=89401 RepID=UPI00147817A7|nr:hypothetical protein [Colwellia demingiae]
MTITNDKEQTVVLELNKKNIKMQPSQEFQFDINQENNVDNFDYDTSNYVLGYN